MDKESVVYQLVAANYLSVQPRFCCKLIGVGYSITSIHPVCLELDFFATITLINFLIWLSIKLLSSFIYLVLGSLFYLPKN
jgi:hypothetical protein